LLDPKRGKGNTWKKKQSENKTRSEKRLICTETKPGGIAIELPSSKKPGEGKQPETGKGKGRKDGSARGKPAAKTPHRHLRPSGKKGRKKELRKGET